MRVEVLVIQPGDRQPIYHWRDDRAGGRRLPGREVWEQVSLTIVRKQHDRDGLRPEVFLCVRDNCVVGFDYDVLRSCVEMAHNYIWGAHLHLALDSNAGASEETRAPEPSSVNAWFEVLEKNGVTDLIQCDLRVNDQGRMNAQEIISASDRIGGRRRATQRLLHRQTSALEWKCVSYPTDYIKNPLLADYAAPKHAPRPYHRVLVLASGGSAELSGYLKRKLREDTGGDQVVATVDGVSQNEVSRICEKIQPQAPAKVLRFVGQCELRFFLQQLSGHARAMRVYRPPDERVISVTLDPRPVFELYDVRSRPSLLMTNSFHADHETSDCLDACKDIGQLIREVPRTAWRTTHHAIDLTRLRNVLSWDHTPNHLTIWLHLGHGMSEGLQEYTPHRDYKNPDEWLRSFGGRRRGLALAFFSSCYSLDIAELFARAGAGVAIGFTNPVDAETCRILSAPVVRAALRSNGSPQAILEAFRQALAHGRLEAEPRAFSSHT